MVESEPLLSLAVRVLVVNIDMFTLFSYPNRHFFMPRVLLQEVERIALRFFDTHHMDQIGNVLGNRHIVCPSRFEIGQCRQCCLLTKPGLIFAAVRSLRCVVGEDNTLFFPNPAIRWKIAFDFFRHTVGTTHSDVLKEAGQRRPMRHFRFLYQWLASAGLHRWETYLESRVQAKGWDGPGWDGPMLCRALRHLPRSVPQSHGWSLLKVHLNAPIASARLAAARVVDEPSQ